LVSPNQLGRGIQPLYTKRSFFD